MAQLKVKQISDFVTAVGTIHNGVVGTGTATAIATAKSQAITAAGLDATSKADAALSSAKTYADTAESDAIATAALDATSKADAALSSAKTYADTAEADAISTAALDATTKANNALVSAKSYSDIQKLRIDALLLNSTDALDSFAEIKGFIDELDTADIVGLVNDISTAKLEAINSAVSQAEAKDVVRATAASTALTNAISTEVLDRNAAILVLDNDLQSQINALAGVNSDEVIATLVEGSKLSFDAGKVFNLNGHVAVFVNGLQIHEAGEGVDGWSSENGRLFTVAGLGYELEATDHIVVSGTLA